MRESTPPHTFMCRYKAKTRDCWPREEQFALSIPRPLSWLQGTRSSDQTKAAGADSSTAGCAPLCHLQPLPGHPAPFPQHPLDSLAPQRYRSLPSPDRSGRPIGMFPPCLPSAPKHNSLHPFCFLTFPIRNNIVKLSTVNY